MLAKAITKAVNVRKAPDSRTNGNVIGTLKEGEQVELVKQYKDGSRWWKVTWNGQTGYLVRKYVTPVDCPPPVALDAEVERIVNDTIARASEDYDAITYGLGCKCKCSDAGALVFSEDLDFDRKPCKGSRVDCSGWIAGLAQLIFSEIDKAAGRPIFGPRAADFLAHVSDAQVVRISNRSGGRIWSGPDIETLTLRGGMVFGIDKTATRYEGVDRVFNIDHVVMGFMKDGVYHISQSSGGGKGVNVLTWEKWKKAWKKEFEEYRIHAVDLLGIANWDATESSAFVDTPVEDIDFLNAPAG